MSKRRVVITGLGMISPVGVNLQESWQNLVQGKSGICAIEHFDTTDYPSKIAGLVKGFNPEQFGFTPKDNRKMDMFIQYGIAAGMMAFEDSGLKVTPDHCLIDAMPLSELKMPHTSIIHGDARCASVAAASIIAKVVRDEYMEKMDVIISATNSPHYTFLVKNTKEYIDDSKERLFIDLAIPRDIEEDIDSIPGCVLKNMDYIKSLAKENNDKKISEAKKIEILIQKLL